MEAEAPDRFFSDIGQLLPDLFAVFDAATLKLTCLNPAGLARLDPTCTANLENATLPNFIGINDADRYQREIHPLFHVRGLWRGSLALRDMLGTEFRAKTTLQAIKHQGRHYVLLHCDLPRDASEGTETLVTDEDMLHALLETTPSSVYFKDTASRYLRISRNKAAKHGLADPRDSIGKTDFDYFTVEHASPAYEDEQRIIKTGVPIIDYEEKETFPDGSIRWVSSTKLPFHNRSGKLVGTFGISRDITTEKQAEESLRQREALFRTVFNGSNDAILLFSQNHFIDCNAKASQLFGYTRMEITCLRIADVSADIQPDGRPAALVAPEKTRETIAAGVTHFEWIYRRKDGSCFPAEVVLTAFDLEGRTIIHGAIRDLTDKKLAERERRELESRLQLSSKLESVGSLAAGVAHEINTPTQFISDNIRFLQDSFKQLHNVIAAYKSQALADPACTAKLAALSAVEKENELDYLLGEIPRCLDQSLDGLRRIAKIVGSLKEFSHPGGDAKSQADLNRAIDTTIAVSRHEWKYVAEVVTELDPGLPPVNCVLDEINQAILNLVVNAAHAIEDALKQTGQKQGRITIRTRKDGDKAVIEVQDTGTGIPVHVREKIFEPFFTTKGVGRGTGQGLAIVQAIVVKKHKGTISFKTEIGQGTTFIITIPLQGPQTRPPLAPQENPSSK